MAMLSFMRHVLWSSLHHGGPRHAHAVHTRLAAAAASAANESRMLAANRAGTPIRSAGPKKSQWLVMVSTLCGGHMGAGVAPRPASPPCQSWLRPSPPFLASPLYAHPGSPRPTLPNPAAHQRQGLPHKQARHEAPPLQRRQQPALAHNERRLACTAARVRGWGRRRRWGRVQCCGPLPSRRGQPSGGSGHTCEEPEPGQVRGAQFARHIPAARRRWATDSMQVGAMCENPTKGGVAAVGTCRVLPAETHPILTT